MFSAIGAMWRESVAPIIRPGATTVPGNSSRTVRAMSRYDGAADGEIGVGS